MIKLKKKIARPYFLVIVLIPLMIILVFNLLVSVFARIQVEEDLKAISAQTTNELAHYTIGAFGQPVPNIFNLLKYGTDDENAELVVYDENGTVSVTSQVGYVADALFDTAYQKVKQADSFDVVTFQFEGQTYYAIEVDVKMASEFDTAIYISKGHFVYDFVYAVNLVLICVSLGTIILFLFVSNKVAKTIVTPIEEIERIVRTMNAKELILIEEKQSSEELQNLCDEINRMSRRIYEYDKAQKSFLQNASHELRTPLMSISGFAEGMQAGLFADTVQPLEVIRTESERLTNIVESLLKLSRLEGGDVEYPMTALPLHELVQSNLNKVSGLAMREDRMLVFQNCDDIYIDGHEELLGHVLINLLSNSIKYANTKVKITLTQEEMVSIIRIEDDGQGIPEKDLPHIFERFYKGKNGNFGLGLSIAKISAEKMGGSISAYNTNVGAVFEVVLKTCAPTQVPM